MVVSKTKDHKFLRTRIVKGRPLFNRHLYISSALFLIVIGVVTFFLIQLASRWAKERVNIEIEGLSNYAKEQIKNQMHLLDMELTKDSPDNQILYPRLMEEFLDQMLVQNDQIVYIFAQDLSGVVIWKSLQIGSELEQNYFPNLILSSKNSRRLKVHFNSITNPAERYTDWVEPIFSRNQLRFYVHFGFNNTLITSRMNQDQKRINRQILLAAFVVTTILLLALFYIVWLLKRAQMIEAEAHTAERLVTLGTVATGLAHEIRNPLSAINLNLQMIEEDLAQSEVYSDEIKKLLGGAKSEIRRLERLASNFLIYAKPLKLDEKVIILPEVLNEVAQLMTKECEKEKIQLIRQDGPGDLTVLGDRDLLQQALLNLLVNAREAILPQSDRTREILLGVHQEVGQVVVSIKNSGNGIGKEESKKLFDLFYSSKRGGTGLGLPIAQRIVEGHGGRLKWKNQSGGGVEFSIHLPV